MSGLHALRRIARILFMDDTKSTEEKVVIAENQYIRTIFLIGEFICVIAYVFMRV